MLLGRAAIVGALRFHPVRVGRRGDGAIDALYGHWIPGKQAVKRQPRWSIMRNVLHWVD